MRKGLACDSLGGIGVCHRAISDDCAVERERERERWMGAAGKGGKRVMETL